MPVAVFPDGRAYGEDERDPEGGSGGGAKVGQGPRRMAMGGEEVAIGQEEEEVGDAGCQVEGPSAQSGVDGVNDCDHVHAACHVNDGTRRAVRCKLGERRSLGREAEHSDEE